MPRKSLSRAELFATLLAILLLSSLLFAQVSDSRELANRSVCAANVRGIMQSIVVYSADFNDVYPTLKAASATTYTVTFAPDTAENLDTALLTMSKRKENTNNPSAHLWMLAATGSVAPKQFICRSDPTGIPTNLMDANSKVYTNFPDPRNLSYSTAYPWAEFDKKIVSSSLWRNTMDAGLPIMSDMAPYFGRPADYYKPPADAPDTPEGRAATQRLIADLTSPDFDKRDAATQNLATKGAPAYPGLRQAVTTSTDPELIARVSPYLMGPAIPSGGATEQWVVTKSNSANHMYDGQNVGFADAHAEFSRTPSCGEANDSLWGIISDPNGRSRKEIPIAAGALPHTPLIGKQGATQGDFDTVMVPTRDAKGNLR